MARSSCIALLIAATLVLGAPSTGYAQNGGSNHAAGLRAFEADDYRSAINIWTPLADAGDPQSIASLAQMYRLGLGVNRNDRRAFSLYLEAAEAGLPEAQVNTAFLYLTGQGTPKNARVAAEWFARAADRGDARAQFNLGLMFERGVGVERDEELARELYSIASAQGQERATERLQALNESRKPDQGNSDLEARVLGQSPVPRQKSNSETVQPPTPPAPARNVSRIDPSQVPAIPPAPRVITADIAEDTGRPVLILRRSAPESSASASNDAATALESADTPRRKPNAGATTAPQILEASAQPREKPPLVQSTPQPNRQATVAPIPQQRNPVRQDSTVNLLLRGEAAYGARDYVQARQIFATLAQRNVPLAQFWLGRMYNRGEGVQLDRFEAYSLWRVAAQNGSTRAATALVNLSSRISANELRAAEAYHLSRRR